MILDGGAAEHTKSTPCETDEGRGGVARRWGGGMLSATADAVAACCMLHARRLRAAGCGSHACAFFLVFYFLDCFLLYPGCAALHTFKQHTIHT